MQLGIINWKFVVPRVPFQRNQSKYGTNLNTVLELYVQYIVHTENIGKYRWNESFRLCLV